MTRLSLLVTCAALLLSCGSDSAINHIPQPPSGPNTRVLWASRPVQWVSSVPGTSTLGLSVINLGAIEAYHDRRIDVSWGNGDASRRSVTLDLIGHARPGAYVYAYTLVQDIVQIPGYTWVAWNDERVAMEFPFRSVTYDEDYVYRDGNIRNLTTSDLVVNVELFSQHSNGWSIARTEVSLPASAQNHPYTLMANRRHGEIYNYALIWREGIVTEADLFLPKVAQAPMNR